jgi:hypothetical protein
MVPLELLTQAKYSVLSANAIVIPTASRSTTTPPIQNNFAFISPSSWKKKPNLG